LPFERSDVGDGYAGSGPVTTYYMNPEEVKRLYGPTKPRKINPWHQLVLEAVRISNSPDEAAEILKISTTQLNRYLGAKNIYPRWGKREADNVGPFETYEDNRREETAAVVTGPVQDSAPVLPEERTQCGIGPATFIIEHKTKMELAMERISKEKYLELKHHGLTDREICEQYDIDPKNMFPRIKNKWGPLEIPKPKTRLEIAREKLSVEKYQELKSQSMTDQKIQEQLDIAVDVMIALKREWGIYIKSTTSPEKRNEEDPWQVDQELKKNISQPVTGLTIAQALQLRRDMAEDAESLGRILEVAAGGAELTGRVVAILERERETCLQVAARIDKALDSTVIEI